MSGFGAFLGPITFYSDSAVSQYMHDYCVVLGVLAPPPSMILVTFGGVQEDTWQKSNIRHDSDLDLD